MEISLFHIYVNYCSEFKIDFIVWKCDRRWYKEFVEYGLKQTLQYGNLTVKVTVPVGYESLKQTLQYGN